MLTDSILLWGGHFQSLQQRMLLLLLTCSVVAHWVELSHIVSTICSCNYTCLECSVTVIFSQNYYTLCTTTVNFPSINRGTTYTRSKVPELQTGIFARENSHRKKRWLYQTYVHAYVVLSSKASQQLFDFCCVEKGDTLPTE